MEEALNLSSDRLLDDDDIVGYDVIVAFVFEVFLDTFCTVGYKVIEVCPSWSRLTCPFMCTVQ